MTDEAKAFLLGDELTPAEKDEFVKYLIHKENFALAREVWASKIKTAAALTLRSTTAGSKPSRKVIQADSGGRSISEWQRPPCRVIQKRFIPERLPCISNSQAAWNSAARSFHSSHSYHPAAIILSATSSIQPK